MKQSRLAKRHQKKEKRRWLENAAVRCGGNVSLYAGAPFVTKTLRAPLNIFCCASMPQGSSSNLDDACMSSPSPKQEKISLYRTFTTIIHRCLHHNKNDNSLLYQNRAAQTHLKHACVILIACSYWKEPRPLMLNLI